MPSRDSRSLIGLILVGVSFIGGFVGCQASTSSLTRPGLISKWEKKIQLQYEDEAIQTGLSRSLAAEARPRCLKDRIKGAMLRDDATRLEAEKSVPPLKGRWQGIELEKMPAAQAQFLNFDDGQWVHKDGLNFDGCKDVPCILNQVYGKPDSDAGWLVYWWWLRMGYVLSCAKEIPLEKPFDGTTIQHHLFSEKELEGFWKLSWMLSDTFRNMRALQTIHRIPAGKSRWGVSVCGYAYGDHEMGHIRVSDGCLRFSWNDSFSESAFYISMTHEISHRMDSWLGGRDVRLSKTEKWRQLSGWREQDVIDPANPNRVIREYRSDPTKDGFVRDYAGSNPAEDWAETVAYFRFNPEHTLKVSPNKSRFISEKVFHDRFFDQAGLGEAYEKMASRQVLADLPRIIEACVVPLQDDPGTDSTNEGALVFDVPVPKSVVRCIEKGLGAYLTVALDEIRATEYEACDYLSQGRREMELRARIFGRLKPDIEALLRDQSALAPMLRASQELRGRLSAEVDFREVYLHCYRQDEPENCYSTLLSEAFVRIANDYRAELGDAYTFEQRYFLENLRFEKAKSEVLSFYGQLFSESHPLLKEIADGRWMSCLSQAPDVAETLPAEAISTQPFSGGRYYVSAAILTCINRQALSDVDEVRDRHAATVGVSLADPDAAALVREILLPRYLSVLNQNLERDAAKEEAELNQYKSRVMTDLLEGLTQDMKWAEGTLEQDGLMSRCRLSAQAKFESSEAAKTLFKERRLHFVSKEDLSLSWTLEACSRTIHGSAVERVRSEAQRQWKRALKELEDRVLQGAQNEALQCQAKNPGNSVVSKRNRKWCLQDSWSKAEEAGRKAWNTSETGRKFQWRVEEADRHLQNRRLDLQDVAIRRMETS